MAPGRAARHLRWRPWRPGRDAHNVGARGSDVTVEFAAPTDLEEALALLAKDPAARPIAGGTDLVVAARQGRRPLPESIVAIDRIAELAGHAVVDGALVLGALTPHDWLAT